VSVASLKKELAKIALTGYAIKRSFVERGHVRASKFDVDIKTPRNRSLAEIERLIAKSRLAPGVKDRMQKVYKTLADAETHVHGHRHKDIHFEQLGDIDSLVDIAAACIALDLLGVEKIIYSFVPVTAKLAPATARLLEGRFVYFIPLFFENVTPTGMAILAALGEQAGSEGMRACRYGSCGYGAGTADPSEIANVLRVTEVKTLALRHTDEVMVLEANIDDMNPQFFEPLFETVLAAGALDVFVQSVIMKKSRPGFLLTVLVEAKHHDMIADIVFRETTTIGLRCYAVRRLKLEREQATFQWRGQKIDIKLISLPGGRRRAVPEYDTCRRLAALWQRPVQDVHEELRRKAELQWPSQV
jgi:uncharacterized protein (TIGR00299 family) protein